VKTSKPRIVLSLRNREELLEFVRRAVVPLHIEGRRNIDREVWSLFRYLFALGEHDRVEFPVSVSYAVPGESPDFVLEFAGQMVGLEVTEATTSKFHEQLEMAEQSIDGIYFDPLDPGWMGDSPERVNSELVVTAILGKAASLAKGGWRTAQNQDLLIYCENAPGPGVKNSDLLARVRPVLVNLLQSDAALRAFRYISLIAGGKLIFDVVGECSETPISI
jgi:hypothetical protein